MSQVPSDLWLARDHKEDCNGEKSWSEPGLQGEGHGGWDLRKELGAWTGRSTRHLNCMLGSCLSRASAPSGNTLEQVIRAWS